MPKVPWIYKGWENMTNPSPLTEGRGPGEAFPFYPSLIALIVFASHPSLAMVNPVVIDEELFLYIQSSVAFF